MKFRAVALLLAIGLATIAGTQSAFAQPADSSTMSPSLTGALQEATTDKPIDDEALRSTLTSRSQSEFAAYAVLGESESYDLAHSRIVERRDGSYLVSVPITGAEYGSSMSVLLDSKLNPVSTIQISLREIDESSGTVEMFVDGDQTFSQVVTAPEESNGPQARGMNWGDLNRCLSAAGISSWAIAGLSVLCGAACAATAGAACLGCIAVAGGIAGGTVGGCVASAWH
ncbi:hypothetical protein DBV08_00350 [Rhodococcus sp. KBW08]|nr:hypothetical protein DBV08_00350 [Rhodococcus sp. KBW08]